MLTETLGARWPSPLVLAIGGAAYLIYTHWDSIKSAFRTGMVYLAGVGERMLTFGRNIVQGLPLEKLCKP